MARFAIIDTETDEIIGIEIWDSANDIPERSGLRYQASDDHMEWYPGGYLTTLLEYTPAPDQYPEE